MKKLPTLEKMWWPIVILSGLVVFTLTMLFSVGQSIWFDEGYSILLAKSDWSELFALTAVDAHPPFYYVLLKIWGSLFGFGETALRALSALLLSGAVVVTLALLRRVFSAKVALLALPVIVFAPFMIRYGYEVRMYSLALLLAVTATYAMIVANEKQQWWRWAIYAALVALGMYTLYMTVVVWLAHFVWLLVTSLKSKQYTFWKNPWIYAYVGAVVLFLPYIGTFIYQMVYSALPGVGNEITLTRAADMATVLFLYTPEWQIGGWLSLLILAGIILVSLVGFRAAKFMSKNEKKYFGLIVAIVLIAIGFYALTSLPPRTPIFINRYLAHIAVFIYALVGVTLAFGIVYRQKLKTKTARALPIVAYAVVIVILGIGLVRLQTAGNFVFERMQHPQTQQIREGIACNDATTVIADDPYTYIDSVFYFDDCDLKFFAEEEVANKGGYAPLHGSEQRVSNSSEITTPYIVHLNWDGRDTSMIVDDRYELESSRVYDKQRVDTYKLIAE